MLQLQLEARSRARSSQNGAAQVAQATPSTLRGFVRKAGKDIQSRDDLRRAVIEHLLAARLGSHLRNEPKFQHLLEQVHEALADQSDWTALLDRTIEDLMAG